MARKRTAADVLERDRMLSAVEPRELLLYAMRGYAAAGDSSMAEVLEALVQADVASDTATLAKKSGPLPWARSYIRTKWSTSMVAPKRAEAARALIGWCTLAGPSFAIAMHVAVMPAQQLSLLGVRAPRDRLKLARKLTPTIEKLLDRGVDDPEAIARGVLRALGVAPSVATSIVKSALSKE